MKIISDLSDVKVTKQDNLYMFLITPWFMFLDVRNYLAPGLSYNGWCKANECSMKKLVFPYESLDNYERLTQVAPVLHKAFYSKLKGNITRDEYEKFVQDFNEQGCITVMDWLKVYNEVRIFPFIEALDKTHKQYNPDKIDMCKDAVSIPGISMTYVLNKLLKINNPANPLICTRSTLCTRSTSVPSVKSIKNVAVMSARKYGMVVCNVQKTSLTNC